MNLQTKIPLKQETSNQIDYNSKLLLLGSCFVENIGEKLDYFKFQNHQNPFGILFNPLVIERLITNAIDEKIYSEEDIFFHNERWHCYDAHSDLSSSSKDELLKKLNDSARLTNQQIAQSTHIIITLGTAWVYRHIVSNQMVANCHKVPQKQFRKEILSVDNIFKSISSTVTKIKEVNPEASIIFTVSPVRHLKDGFVENQQSKAHLISAIHQFLNRQSSPDSYRNINRTSFYFPSYEIMMDELRDYRFYAEDMIHPNTIAVDYIWEKFKYVWISPNVFTIMDEVESIQKGLTHQPFNPESKEHQSFINKIKLKKVGLEKRFPGIKF